MSVRGYGAEIQQLQNQLKRCASMDEFREISKTSAKLTKSFSSDSTRSQEDIFELLELSNKVEEMKIRFPLSEESFVILHRPLKNTYDYLHALLTFETQESWNRKLQTFEEAGNTPCYFMKLSAIWKKIPKSIRNQVDEQIYLCWFEDTKQTTDDFRKGRTLRKTNGFTDPLIKKALEIFCVKNAQSLKRRSTESLPSDLSHLVDKISSVLNCPVENDLVSDLCVTVPCGHNIGAANYLQLSNKDVCIMCRNPVEKVVPNYAARGILQQIQNLSSEN